VSRVPEIELGAIEGCGAGVVSALSLLLPPPPPQALSSAMEISARVKPTYFRLIFEILNAISRSTPF
jgi:hypothetical protein